MERHDPETEKIALKVVIWSVLLVVWIIIT